MRNDIVIKLCEKIEKLQTENKALHNKLDRMRTAYKGLINRWKTGKAKSLIRPDKTNTYKKGKRKPVAAPAKCPTARLVNGGGIQVNLNTAYVFYA